MDRFDEHDGPVRGVCFHPTQPLFVSGGDDYKIKVWNYKQRRCLFTLLGHLDYIRTVQFHHEAPWILSASDDQTIRIWNWQNRSSVAVLTGHNHYVMSALFHPREDLVVSASLDQTVRVWDISALRKRSVTPGGSGPGGLGGGGGGTGGPGGEEFDLAKGLRLPPGAAELFGSGDVIVKYVLEGHDRGVNWACFHPTGPFLASGADDRCVKLWRMNDTKAWEMDTLRGHFNNVSCVLFHPRQDLVLSNSEDHTIRVWDLNRRQALLTFRREHDRFWILAAHPELNLFAAGHDSGLVIFKLERERPPFAAAPASGHVYYLRDRYLRQYEAATGRDVPLLALRRSGGGGGGGQVSALDSTSGGGVVARSLSYNAAERALLLHSDAEGGYYELYQVPADPKADAGEPRRGSGLAAVFVARNRFVVLEKGGASSSRALLVKNLKNETTKRCEAPYPQADALLPAPAGLVLVRADDRLALFDVQQRRVLRELQVSGVKQAIWAGPERTANVALLGKDFVLIANGHLEQLCLLHETMRVKSGAWDENGVFLYTTSTHVKYALPNGDSGIVRTLEVPVYLCAVRGNKLHCLDREYKMRVLAIDNTEYLFKLALVRRRYEEVLRMVREANLVGEAIVSYLQRKGFPEVALQFVKEPYTRFALALECGNIEAALECAKQLDERDLWHRLGVEALRQGNHQVVEMAYQRTKNFERLSFLYLITGNLEKLRKMLRIAEMRQDASSRFHNALYLGDVAERVRLLEQAGLPALAYACAHLHGLSELAEQLRQRLTPEQLAALPDPLPPGRLLVPPAPVLRMHDANWPLLTVARGYFEGAFMEDPKAFGLAPDDAAAAGGWDIGDEEPKAAAEAPSSSGEERWDLALEPGAAGTGAGRGGGPGEEGEEGGEGWGLSIEGLNVPEPPPGERKAAAGGYAAPPPAGPSLAHVWTRSSRLAHDHALAGSLETCFQLLQAQIGVVNFEPLHGQLQALFVAGRAQMPTLSGLPSLPVALSRPPEDARGSPLPVQVGSLRPLLTRLQSAYRAVTEAKFQDALQLLLSIMHALPFVVAESRQEVGEARELLALCREYVLGLRLEMTRRELAKAGQPATLARQLELAAYFTHCNLQVPHLVLALASGMRLAYQAKNFATAGGFARRLLDLNPSKQDLVQMAQKVARHADSNPTNELRLNYDERNPFQVCAISLSPIYKGSPAVLCPFCGAAYLPEHKGKTCTICLIAQIGRDASGLLLSEKFK